MTVAILLSGLALRAGLGLRSARRLGRRRDAGLYRRHLRVAKIAVALVALGGLSGPVSMVWLRGRPAFETAHALAAVAAITLFLATAVLGRRLERGRSRARDRHALLALLAVLAAAASFGTGFVLLP